MNAGVLYAKNRRLWLIFVGIVACVIVTPLIGYRYTPFSEGKLSGQLWAYSSIPAAIMISGAASSAMSALENHATHTYRRCNALAVAALTAIGFLLFVGFTLATPTYAQALVTGRNLLFWTGMALMAERALGERFAFLPLAAWFIVLQGFGESDDALRLPSWWAIPIRLRDDPWSWIATVLVFTAGIALVYTKPARPHQS